MNKFLLFLLIVVSASVTAQTTITTTTVSGTWTLSGSPYLVQNYINIPVGQSLTIEPGVDVKFVPTTKLVVDGQLIAAGTQSLPIVFEATDTTGWSNQTTTAGGWNGVHFFDNNGAADNSIFQYCTVKDQKYGFPYLVYTVNAFTCFRSLKILNCTFTHNHSGVGANLADPTVNLALYHAGDTIEFNGCTVTDNYSSNGIIRTTNTGGYTQILNSEIGNNHLGSGIWAVWNNLLIENNEVHDNEMIYDNAPIKISIGNVIVRGNKVYNNVCEQLAAVGCRSGHVTIENNLICNNQQTSANCGLTGGGGGIHLSHNEGAVDFTDTYYIVRNNIIANNFTAFGGGGIYVYHARATISNNDIINNFTPNTLGKAVLINDPMSEVYMKNNIFFSKSTAGVVDTNLIIFVMSANKIKLDYNYLPAAYSSVLTTSTTFTLVGPTNHNVIGTTPGMVSPTLNNDYTISALTADFNLLNTSPCNSQGDTVGCFTAAIDYAGNQRINGTIEIGAYELAPQEGIENNLSDELNLLSVYPNPVTANNMFHVITPEAKGVLTIQDLMGRIIYCQTVTATDNRVSLINAFGGIYIISFQGKKNFKGKLMLI